MRKSCLISIISTAAFIVAANGSTVMSGVIVAFFCFVCFFSGLQTTLNDKQFNNLTNLASNSVGLYIFYEICVHLAAIFNDLSGPVASFQITASEWLPSLGDLPKPFAMITYSISLLLFGIGLGSGLSSWCSGILLIWRLLTSWNRQGSYRKRGRIWQVFVAVSYIIATLGWFRGLALR